MTITSWRIIPYLRVFYGKNHVGKIKDLFYCYIFRTCHSSNLVLLSYFGFLLRSAGLLKNII